MSYNCYQTTAKKAVRKGDRMLITTKLAEKVRVKRAKAQQTKKAVAEELGIKPQTYTKVENGDYDAPKRIYEAVMNWLVEDL
jgi:raw score 4.15